MYWWLRKTIKRALRFQFRMLAVVLVSTIFHKLKKIQIFAISIRFFFRSAGKRIEWFPFGSATSWTFHFDFDSVCISRCYSSSGCYWFEFYSKCHWLLLAWRYYCWIYIYLTIDAKNEIFKRMTKFLSEHANTYSTISCSFRKSNLQMQNECVSFQRSNFITFCTSDMNSMFHVPSALWSEIRMHYYYSSFLHCLMFTCCVSVIVIFGCMNNKATRVINCREWLFCCSAMHVITQSNAFHTYSAARELLYFCSRCSHFQWIRLQRKMEEVFFSNEKWIAYCVLCRPRRSRRLVINLYLFVHVPCHFIHYHTMAASLLGLFNTIFSIASDLFHFPFQTKWFRYLFCFFAVSLSVSVRKPIEIHMTNELFRNTETDRDNVIKS